MSDTLYLKIDQNVLVHKPNVVLRDIASLTCTNASVVSKLKTMKVHTFHETGWWQEGQAADRGFFYFKDHRIDRKGISVTGYPEPGREGFCAGVYSQG